ncbi:MAG: FAD-dependent oxidoreductase [Kiritimatiellia bacterium]|jgi:hypothetical protein
MRSILLAVAFLAMTTSPSFAASTAVPAGAPPQVLEADVAVVGGGSAGFAAAWSAALLGSRVVLVEKEQALGGTSTIAGVNNWEPGMGGTGVPYRVYQRLSARPDACAPYVMAKHCMWPEKDQPYTYPGALATLDPSIPYAATLRRHGPGLRDKNWFRENCHGIIFEADEMSATLLEMLRETGRCEVLLGIACTGAETGEGNHVERIVLSDGRKVAARVFVDATDGVLCGMLGCERMFGRDARSDYGEPGAPDKPRPTLNGATLMFRVEPAGSEAVEPLPEDVPEACWWAKRFPLVFAMACPRGGYSMNMLPTMAGEEVLRLGLEAAYAECRRRVLAEWHWLQRDHAEFRSYRLASIAPSLALRETCRVRGEYVLTQHDLIAGLAKQKHPDIIAIADHPMDNHGGGGPNGELNGPYGIPYRCLLPLGTRNVLVAGRAASFSSIAASSCRLSRTMMQLGEAAGVAAFLAVRDDIPLREVDAAEIRRCMAEKIDGDPFQENQ